MFRRYLYLCSEFHLQENCTANLYRPRSQGSRHSFPSAQYCVVDCNPCALFRSSVQVRAAWCCSQNNQMLLLKEYSMLNLKGSDLLAEYRPTHPSRLDFPTGQAYYRIYQAYAGLTALH